MAHVVIHALECPPQRMKLVGPITIGRAIDCNLWIDDPKLSRRHCRIEPQGNDWVVVDLRSTNGTFLAGSRVDRHTLREGDTIEVGHSRIVFREGDYVAHRPADPFEASHVGAGVLAQKSPDATSVAYRLATTSTSNAASGSHSDTPKGVKALPIAFARPPAKPIVHDESANWWWRGRRWLKAIVSRLGRGRPGSPGDK